MYAITTFALPCKHVRTHTRMHAPTHTKTFCTVLVLQQCCPYGGAGPTPVVALKQCVTLKERWLYTSVVPKAVLALTRCWP